MKNKTGIELIAEERRRQIEKEGWTPEHDADHEDESIALAAVTYATPEIHRTLEEWGGTVVPDTWPWGVNAWKPTSENRIKELQKAGALIAAEIDRLQKIKS